MEWCGFILAKIADSPYENRPSSRGKGIIIGVECNRKMRFSPMRTRDFPSARSPKLYAQPGGNRTQHLSTHVQRRQRSIAHFALTIIKRAVRISEEKVIRLREHA